MKILRRILFFIVAFVLIICVWVYTMGEYNYVAEPYTYKALLSDAQTANVRKMRLVPSNVAVYLEDDPRARSVLKAMWEDQPYHGIKFSPAIKNPLVRLQIADALLSLEESPRKEYVDYIYECLKSNNDELRYDAVAALSTVFDNEAVRTLRQLIVHDPKLAKVAIEQLGKMAMLANSSENLAMKVLVSIKNGELIDDKSLQQLAGDIINKVNKEHIEIGPGGRVLTEPINSGNTYPPTTDSQKLR